MDSTSTKRKGRAKGVLVNMFQNHPTNYIAGYPAGASMSKLKRSAKQNCYGCDSLDYDEKKPLLDGWCLYYDKPVRVASTDQGFFHMQVAECLFEK